MLLVAAPAAVDDVVASLRQDALYVSSDSSLTPDGDAVREALAQTSVPTYVAVVPQEQVDAAELGIDGLMLQIVDGLADPKAVVYVVSDGGELQAGEGGASGVDAGGILDRVLAERIDEPFDATSVTGALVDIARLVDADADAEPGSTRRTVGLVGLVATVAIGGGGLLYTRAQRRLRASAPLTDERGPDDAGWH
ncbi:MAG: hypothetical protein JWN08_177 [Frankiales bacterium]|nr:hypothetical protein [Frankiales bacterium]